LASLGKSGMMLFSKLSNIQQLNISRYYRVARQKSTWRAVTCSTHV